MKHATCWRLRRTHRRGSWPLPGGRPGWGPLARRGRGLTWTRLDGVSTGALHGAAWIGPSAVLVGDAGAIYWSPGGFENWEPAEPAVTTNLYAVALAGNELLAVGADGVVLWSNWLDGRVWRLADVPVPVSGVSWGRMKQLFRH